ncbi:DUF397 domain-containing protein [Streptomyces sp. NRRL B-1347]|uniref:DUF397 domain-containing protein n=1 Tax=Streptomyces sp. NRRL B-1347 TaxID=1476877 RepID=UPI0004CC4175|nr:DUF397 domain-containing protein [Streptomyces sp. NRRL B-1347]
MTRKSYVGGASELEWFKSSYSDSSNINDCVEVALEWAKSSYSSSNEGTDCVEVATTPGTIHVRDSKNKQGPCLGFSAGAWRDFLQAATS